MARSEPFRSLLEMAVLAPEPVAILAAKPVAPPPALVPFERRLDTVVLPAGATPPRGMRAFAPQALVPLRLEAPSIAVVPPPRPEKSATPPEPTMAPASVMLAFLDEATRPDFFFGSTDEAPRKVAPVADLVDADASESIRVRLRRLRGVQVEATPTRPLPAVSADSVFRGDVGDKVITFQTSSRHGVQVRAFSSNDTDDGIDLTIEGDGFDDPDLIDDRAHRAPAAIALSALSDEGDGESDPFDDYAIAAAAGSAEDLDVLADALGLAGGLVVLRTALSDDDELLFEDAVVEAADVLSLDGDGASALDDADIEAAGDGTSTDTLPVTDPGFIADAGDDDSFLDDDEVTPPRGTPRPALVAPRAVRVVVEDAPARPRHGALSAGEAARSRLRARDLYLVALDDLGNGETRSAMGHLQLAIAYDDETELYQELLGQLTKRLLRAG